MIALSFCSVFAFFKEVNYVQTPALALYAQVQQDYMPVPNANVTAIVSDSSTSTTVILRDDGSGEPKVGTFRFAERQRGLLRSTSF